jgi:CotH kinase protein
MITMPRIDNLLGATVFMLTIILAACESTKIASTDMNDSFKKNEAIISESTFKTNLPIVIIDTENQTIHNEPKSSAQLSIINSPTGEINQFKDPHYQFDGRIGIEYRGNSSLKFPKKQYGFETWDDNDDDKDVSLLGFPAESDWILHAPYSDKTMMRNHFAYWLSNSIGRYAPRTTYVEAFINEEGPGNISDHYWGVHLLMEKIKRGKKRVDVAKLEPHQNSDSEISGGYILNLDFDKNNPSDCIADPIPNTSSCLRLVYPDFEDASDEQKAWIGNYIQQFEKALAGADFKDPAIGYKKYIDVDSFVDYLILHELFKNDDGLRRSTFMHKDRNGKLNMGPYWDCNICMGNVAYHGSGNTDGWILERIVQDYPEAIPFWWSRLLEDSDFKERLSQRWQSLRADVLSTHKMISKIEETAQLLKEAAKRNDERWPTLGVYVKFNAEPLGDTYAEEVEQLEDWITQRAIWIDENIEDLQKTKTRSVVLSRWN